MELAGNRVAVAPADEFHRVTPLGFAPEAVQLRGVIEAGRENRDLQLGFGFDRDAVEERDVVASRYHSGFDAQNAAANGAGNNIGPKAIEHLNPRSRSLNTEVKPMVATRLPPLQKKLRELSRLCAHLHVVGG